jgi:hypothetical protein
MKPVFQNRPTNCLQACIASILELKLGEVPDFCAVAGDKWWKALQDWLKERNLFFLMVQLDQATPWYDVPHPALAIMIGFGPNGINHAVVGEVDGDEFKWTHDPHPSGAGIEKIDAIGFLVTLNPLEPAVIPRERKRIVASTILPANGVRFPRG